MLPFPNHEAFIKEIVSAIPLEAKRLSSLLPEPERERLAHWTKAVKNVLKARGTGLSKDTLDFFGTTHDEEDKPTREWLLDAVLYEENKGVLIAVESEFKDRPAAVRDDFRKLLSIKAPLKILIIDSRKNLAEAILTAVNDCAQRFEQHQTGDVYYVLDFHDGKIDVHRCAVGNVREGKAPNFKFEHLEDLSGPERSAAA